MAIVTGAAGGIGAAIARAFAAAGAGVACLDLRAPCAVVGEILADGGDAIALATDVSREAATLAAVAAVTERWGSVQVLVNGAANDDPTGTVLELEPADWAQVMAVHVTGAYLMSRAALPSMIAHGGGSIIHIASQMGRVGAPGRPAYCAAKGALIQLAKAMALDHAAQGGAGERAVARRRRDAAHAVPPRHDGGGADGGGAEAPHRPAGPAGGDRGGGAVPGQRRLQLHDGADLLVDGGYTAI